jgi:hypothetical protein
MDISPDTQNVDRVFSNVSYYIDFYQRDYRWTEEPVRRLLDDIFYKFNDRYERFPDLDPSAEAVSTNYSWYYLNTYITNRVDGRLYVVDGQQRLTTLSLILTKLRHMANQFDSALAPWIESKIAGQHGYERHFWMNHVRHRETQRALLNEVEPKLIDTSSGITAVNMVQNYELISVWLDRELQSNHRFETFVFYFLLRLVLIDLRVEQTDVPMVFEVINDRGVRLRPYEILKGKLLGQIDKQELENGGFHQLWEGRASLINGFKEDELDNFFGFYLKAKFASTRREGQGFDGDYHRAMFSPGMDEKLGLVRSPSRVKEFLREDFNYYTELYAKLIAAYGSEEEEFRGVYFSSLLGLDAPFLLVLSACKLNDPTEDEKIRVVADEIERYYSLLQLQNAYDSNEFADSLYRISGLIREEASACYRQAFDTELRKAVAARRNVDQVDPLSYVAFKQAGINLNTRFKRYFFARIDDLLARNMNLNPKHPMADLVLKTGAKTGFHVEHILSWNEENLALFNGDEELFEQERNRLGGILLLKGKDNISSNNETYREKLESYANTLYWNETLRRDSYKSKLDMRDLRERYYLDLEPLDRFGPEELESRHRLLYEVVKIIWA